MAKQKTPAVPAARPPQPGRASVSDAEARRHIAAVAELQRAARGSAEYVSAPRLRKLLRRYDLLWVWVLDFFGRIWRRLADSHRFPGRWAGRIRLYRPGETLNGWVFFWLAAVVVSASVALRSQSAAQPWDWLSKWVLAGAFGALVASLWHDVVKSPAAVRRIRRQIISDPSLLLTVTLGEQTTQVIELDPPLDTVPRQDLYDELLPGVLARTKDIQIIVGDPGAGKTTALLDLASILARIGLVPVLLQLRGERTSDDLFDLAKKRFEKQVRPLVRTSDDADVVWRWLCRRRRLVFLIDDIDQIGFDGEPGFRMRRLVENLAPEGQAVIVTARPSGVPVGIAASAIPMEPLRFETAVDIVARPNRREPGATTGREAPRRKIANWIQAGELKEAPLYLEALAEMTSVGVCPDLPDNPERWGSRRRPGRWRRLSEWRRQWNPIWVRYLLLERFYARLVDGHVRRSQAIDTPDRRRCLRALEGAALGVLGASGLEAKAAAHHHDEPEESRTGQPARKRLVDFISSDDRQDFDPRLVGDKKVELRKDVSQHEAIATGERLRLLNCDQHEEPQFRHRIMQAFFAGRCLAKLGRREQTGDGRPDPDPDTERNVNSFDGWIETLMDHHHPERLTAHLALTFAALYADDHALLEPEAGWEGLGDRIARKLVEAVEARAPHPRHALLLAIARGERSTVVGAEEIAIPDEGNGKVGLERQLDPLEAPDPSDRRDPDDNLVKLTTAANLPNLLKDDGGRGRSADLPERIIEMLPTTEGAMRWTKQQALPAIAWLDTKEAWREIWTRFARDADYEVRRSAGRQLEKSACRAFSELGEEIESSMLEAGARAAAGLSLGEPADDDSWTEENVRAFEALGWVLPAIVSGLSEELSDEHGGDIDPDRHPVADPASADGASPERTFRQAKARLEELATLAYEGGQAKIEDSLAQGFKADAWRHATGPAREYMGPGWVASNRRLVADIALPHAESWYARMLLYQALGLYAIAGTGHEDTLDMLAYRLHPTRERHPFTRQAAKLTRGAIRRAGLKGERWRAYIWNDDVEDAGTLPVQLGQRATQLVGDVTVLVDLKDGSPPERHAKFGHMEELPYCFSGSHDRHEILGSGCPEHCGWGFCPYRAAAPDEPNEHRGVSRGFCRGLRRAALRQRPPAWQRHIRRRRIYEFWQQMEFKARR